MKAEEDGIRAHMELTITTRMVTPVTQIIVYSFFQPRGFKHPMASSNVWALFYTQGTNQQI